MRPMRDDPPGPTGTDPEAGRGGAAASPILRTMAEGDVEAVARIEARTFSTPWSAATFRKLLGRADAELVVGEGPEGGIVAYAVLWCAADQAELANIAVVEAWRGRGLGSRLLDAVLERARQRGVRSLFLEVRVSNERAARMYEARDFVEVGRRKDYYQDPREDARVLMKHVI